jgi:AraC family transcriptional regulator
VGGIEMNYYYDSILRAVDYIEKNLTEDINLDRIIGCTSFSKFHFMRVFKSILGYSINEYVRRRKITEAARLLIKTDIRIIDIAFMYAYNSQEAFTRAFKEVYDITPNLYRTNKIEYKNIEQLPLSEGMLSLKSLGAYVEPFIVERERFIIAGLEYRGQNTNYEVPKLWNIFSKYMGSIPNRINDSVCYGFEDYEESPPMGNFRYLAGVEVSAEDNLPAETAIRKVPGSKYGVFPIKAIIETVPKSISEIYSTHIPNSGLRIRENYDFEYYDCDFKSNRDNSLLYLYIPIE